MQTIRISGKENILSNSRAISVKPKQQYRIKTKIITKKCRSHTAFFGVFLLDSEGRETDRKFRWIRENENEPKEYELIFMTSQRTRSVVLGYRVNVETPHKDDVEIVVEDLESIKVVEIPNYFDEAFDKPYVYIPDLKPLSIEEENVLEKKMVWILGHMRSGTTWLGRDLLNHDSNIYWHEPCLGWHLDAIKEWNYGRENYFFSHFHKHNWLPSLKKLILARTYSQTQTLTKNVIIKEPNGSSATELIMECFPDSKMIFLLRDGRDVVDSVVDAHRINSWNIDNPIIKFEPILNENMRLNIIEKYSVNWRNVTESVNRAYQKHAPARRLLLKYEDLKKDTLTCLKKMYDFLEIQIKNEDLQRIEDITSFNKIPDSEKGIGKFYRSASPGNWRTNFNEKEKELMLAIMSDTLRKMGYES